jgi:hypothetical protein
MKNHIEAMKNCSGTRKARFATRLKGTETWLKDGATRAKGQIAKAWGWATKLIAGA